jgi:S-DNA-T family DNA segregation ATPase FtsK/SpoIIIE
LTPARRRELVGAALVVLAVVTLVSFISGRGELTASWLVLLRTAFGWGAALVPLALGALGAWLILDGADGQADLRWSRPLGGAILFIAVLGLLHLFEVLLRGQALEAASPVGVGGWIGLAATRALAPSLGVLPTLATLIVLGLVGACLMAGLPLRAGARLGARSLRRVAGSVWAVRARPGAPRPGAVPPATMPLVPAPGVERRPPESAATRPRAADGSPGGSAGGVTPHPGQRTAWRLPRMDEVLEPTVEVQRAPDEAQSMGRAIESALGEFGIPVTVVEINPGPTITQFGLEPGYIERNGKRSKVKVSQILALQNDLSLALAASPLRIQAPVPGRPYVGVEVPNAAATLVSLGGVAGSEPFRKLAARGGLPIALGRDTSGRPVAADLTAMPHLLIAGATGSGKSVAINALITSLILTHTPDTLKLLLVDPKRVELASYRGLPHLAAPLVVEIERIVGVLQWAVREMDRRYKAFADAGVRHIAGYNAWLADRPDHATQAALAGFDQVPVNGPLPYLVIVIDELADLMMIAPEDAERLVTRLAQLARATGIHLVLATQRPSVDVVTGLIKANFPSRIAFAVSSSIDSRVILDAAGAEKLLGRGDMLYMASDSSKLVRLQGCYVSDAEIEGLTRYWKYHARQGQSDAPAALPEVPEPLIQPELWEQMGDPQGPASEEERDELWEEAVALVCQHRTASTSFLQRKLRIGYSRAGRLLDEMEAAGIVAPAQGNQARDVLIGPDEAPPERRPAVPEDVAEGDDDEDRLIRPWLGSS